MIAAAAKDGRLHLLDSAAMDGAGGEIAPYSSLRLYSGRAGEVAGFGGRALDSGGFGGTGLGGCQLLRLERRRD